MADPAPTGPSKLWLLLSIILGIAIGGGAIWGIERKDPAVKRWSKAVVGAPDQAFDSLASPPLIHAPINWQSGDWKQASVSVYSFPATKDPPVTLRDLTDTGQGHAIDFLAKSTPREPHTWAELREALTNVNTEAAAQKDPFKFERVLVSTIVKGTEWEPGDRMIWTRIFVQPINFEFCDYKITDTQNAIDKIASVEATRSRKFSLDLALPAPEGAKAGVQPSDETSVKTTSDINAQYEKLGVDIQRDFLRIIRESNAGGDVAGNALISLSMVTDPATIQRTYTGQPVTAPAGEIALLVTGTHLADGTKDLDESQATATVLPQAPLPHCPLIARVWMLYEQRHITKYGEFYDESRQEVELMRKADPQKDVEIIPADDVAPAVWRIQVVPHAPEKAAQTTQTDGNLRDAAQQLLQGRVDENSPYRDIVFTDYGQASAVAHWIRYNYHNKLDSLHLNYPEGASLVPFKMTDVACSRETKPPPAQPRYQTRPLKQ